MSLRHRVLVVGQAPPQTPPVGVRPFGRSRFYEWLRSAGIPEDATTSFRFAALVSTFPGSLAHGDRAPNSVEIAQGRPQLFRVLARLRPTLIVPVGKLAIKEAISSPTAIDLSSVIGRTFNAIPFAWGRKELLIIPLPHPSGASTWVHTAGHMLLLQKALRALRDALFSEGASRPTDAARFSAEVPLED